MNDKYILVIGGCNADLCGTPYSNFAVEDSNPGIVSISAGGVGRNIAENIARLGLPVKLLSAVGVDSFGDFIKAECSAAGIDTSELIISQELPTSTYLCIMDSGHDLAAAVSDMDIMKLINPELIAARHSLITGAELIVIDNNISPETISAIKEVNPRRILFDAVSGKKLKLSMNEIRDIDTVKLNSIEAGILSGITVENHQEALKAADIISRRNIKHVFITLGAEGALYLSPDGYWSSKPYGLTLRNATGAGDAFFAGTAYGHYMHLSAQALLDWCTACASAAASSEKTVSEKINPANIKLILNGEINELQ